MHVYSRLHDLTLSLQPSKRAEFINRNRTTSGESGSSKNNLFMISSQYVKNSKSRRPGEEDDDGTQNSFPEHASSG